MAPPREAQLMGGWILAGSGLQAGGGGRDGPVTDGPAQNASDGPGRAERLRVATELHDGILQELTVAGFELKALFDSAGPDAKPAIERARTILREQHRLLRHYVAELRSGTTTREAAPLAGTGLPRR